MSRVVKVKWFTKFSDLCENYQQTGIAFSFVSSPQYSLAQHQLSQHNLNTFPQHDLLQCHEWVKCRDFLPDAVRTQITGNPCSIYGFTFNINKNPAIDLNKMRMLVAKASLKGKHDFNGKPNPSESEEASTFKQTIKASLKLLHHFEKIAKVGKTKVTKVDIKDQSIYKSIFLFTGSSMWLKSPFLVSMYSFLIRLGDKKFQFTNNLELKTEFKKFVDYHLNGKNKYNNDAFYLQFSWDKLDLFIKDRSKLFPIKNKVHDIYWESYTIQAFHDRTGIVSLAKSITPDPILNDKIKALTN